MATKTKKASIADQIKTALDGRTQRWLATKIEMAEDKLSNKLRELDEFSEEEIAKISQVLDINIIQ